MGHPEHLQTLLQLKISKSPDSSEQRAEKLLTFAVGEVQTNLGGLNIPTFCPWGHRILTDAETWHIKQRGFSPLDTPLRQADLAVQTASRL